MQHTAARCITLQYTWVERNDDIQRISKYTYIILPLFNKIGKDIFRRHCVEEGTIEMKFELLNKWSHWNWSLKLCSVWLMITLELKFEMMQCVTVFCRVPGADKTKFPWFFFQFFQIRKSLVQLQHIQQAGASYCNTLKHTSTHCKHFTTPLFYSKITKYTMDEKTQKRWIRWNRNIFESLNTVIDFDFQV